MRRSFILIQSGAIQYAIYTGIVANPILHRHFLTDAEDFFHVFRLPLPHSAIPRPRGSADRRWRTYLDQHIL